MATERGYRPFDRHWFEQLFLRLRRPALVVQSGFTGFPADDCAIGLGGFPLPLTLHPVIAPPVGAQAVLLLQETWTRKETRAGRFLDLEAGEASQHTTITVRVQCRMIQPDPLTGNPRIAIEALPIDARTASRFRKEPWRATYVLAAGHAPPAP